MKAREKIIYILRPRLHGNGQISAQTNLARLHGTGGTGRIFKRLSVQVWESAATLITTAHCHATRSLPKIIVQN